MLIGFLRRGRRVVLVPGSIGPRGGPDAPPFGYVWLYDFEGYRLYDSDGRPLYSPKGS